MLTDYARNCDLAEAAARAGPSEQAAGEHLKD